MGMCGFSLTQGAMRPPGQAGKRFGLLGACTFGCERLTLSWPRAVGALTWPGIVEHEEEPHQNDEPEFVKKEGWYHGNAPTKSGEMRAL